MLKKIKPCAYCGYQSPSNASTKDHVIAGAFSDLSKVVNAITVPSCKICNNTKSSEERYAAFILNLASNNPLTYQQNRGYKFLSKKHKQMIQNGQRQIIKLEPYVYKPIIGNIITDRFGNIYQDVAVIKIDYPALEKVFKFIAMGLIYFYCSKFPVSHQFTKIVVAGMDIASEYEISKILNCKADPPYIKKNDEGKYNNDINYAILYSPERALVYMSFYKSILYKAFNIECRIIAVSFEK